MIYYGGRSFEQYLYRSWSCFYCFLYFYWWIAWKVWFLFCLVIHVFQAPLLWPLIGFLITLCFRVGICSTARKQQNEIDTTWARAPKGKTAGPILCSYCSLVYQNAILVKSLFLFNLVNAVFFTEGDIYLKFWRSISICWWKWYGYLDTVILLLIYGHYLRSVFYYTFL